MNASSKQIERLRCGDIGFEILFTKFMRLPRELLEMVVNYCQVHKMAAILRIKGWKIVQAHEVPINYRIRTSKLMKEGCLKLLKLYHEVMPQIFSFHDLDTACSTGNLSIVKWFYSIGKRSRYSLYYTCCEGNSLARLEIVKFLVSQNAHAHGWYSNFHDPVEKAAKNGHLEIIKYFHQVWSDNFTSDVMTYAAQFGHLEIVKFLLENKFDGCTYRAIIRAANNDHYNVCEYLYKNRPQDCKFEVTDRGGVIIPSCYYIYVLPKSKVEYLVKLFNIQYDNTGQDISFTLRNYGPL